MDLQKHAFWIVLGVVLALLLGFLFLMVLPAGGEVDRMQKAIKFNLGQLKTWQNQPSIPKQENIEQAKQQRAVAVKNLLRAVIHLVAQDEARLEGREKDQETKQPLNTPESIGPFFRTRWTKLEQALKAGSGSYSGLRLLPRIDAAGNPQPLKFIPPTLPVESEDVPDFYRKWWAFSMLLDQVLAPVSAEAVKHSLDKQPWKLYEILLEDIEEGDKKSYVRKQLKVKAVVQLRLSDLHKLLQGLLNTPFFVVPARLQVRQAVDDPTVIPIPVPFGQKPPSKEELQQMASRQRPLVEVELVAKVVDLDSDRLLAIGRRYRKQFMGAKKALESFIEDLKADKEFLKGVGDKDKFLDKMRVELLKKP